MTLDDYLSKIYAADLRNMKEPHITAFKTVLNNDPVLKEAAQKRYEALNTMIQARGETACTYSTKYRNYLAQAL